MIKIEIWSDMVCPFCYIGKRNIENALNAFEHRDQVQIEWKSFQLDPELSPNGSNQSPIEYLANRKGISYEQSKEMHRYVTEMASKVGLNYNYDKAIVANSFNAHRLLQLSKKYNLGNTAEERLFSAYFIEGKNIGDNQTLIEIGKSIGLGEKELTESLATSSYSEEVNKDIQEAKKLKINGVPYFIINDNLSISGAQPSKVFLETLNKAYKQKSQ